LNSLPVFHLRFIDLIEENMIKKEYNNFENELMSSNQSGKY